MSFDWNEYEGPPVIVKGATTPTPYFLRRWRALDVDDGSTRAQVFASVAGDPEQGMYRMLSLGELLRLLGLTGANSDS